tara:strand:- start:201 stop:761 length:561 start_codon:yes stop_codon:yes gene_type:complete
VSESVSFKSGVSGRYAAAAFSLADDDGNLNALEKDLKKISTIVETSEDFRSLITSPVYTRSEQEGAISAIADAIKLSANTRNLLVLMARKRRLNVIPNFIDDSRALLEENRGEMTVEVVTASPLNSTQKSKLEKSVEKLVGRKIKLGIIIDKSVIGGLIIKLGSKMIDTTVKSKLLKLQNVMKEVN